MATDKKTANASTATAQKTPAEMLKARLAALAAAPVATYTVGERNQTGAAILAVLAGNPNQAFTEPLLAEAIGAMKTLPGGGQAPRQQAVNGPLRTIAERIQETGEQPAVLAEKGLALVCEGRQVGGKVLKVWLAKPADEVDA